MRSFHGARRRRAYFEGWYVKCQAGDHTLAFIPAYHIDEQGQKSASLQLITDDASYHVPYAAQDFSAQKDRLFVRLGDSWFSDTGCHLAVAHPALTVTGDLSYRGFCPLPRDIMGPFRWVPHMQCRHGVQSMGHDLAGELCINGERFSLDGGRGYVESDRGCSFPKRYLWTQCNVFPGADSCAIVAAAAHIPMAGLGFTGCLCAILYGGREYRIATYRGAHVTEFGPKGMTLCQGTMRLQVMQTAGNPRPLRAPSRGSMRGTIYECAASTVRYVLYEKGRLVFDLTSPHAGFEYHLSENGDTERRKNGRQKDRLQRPGEP